MALALNEIEPPIRLVPESPMSDEQFLRFCAANEPLRFERDANGEIIVMSPTGFEGSGIESEVFTELAVWARADGRGKAFVPTAGFKLPDTSVRAADAAWVSWQRVNSVGPAEAKGFPSICPEFVIEVRSQSDRLAELKAKMEQWIANGAEVAWLIDPIDKTVTVYRPGAAPEEHVNPSSVQGTGPIAGFELVLARVWG
jgi:Uma2 family endonuclease